MCGFSSFAGVVIINFKKRRIKATIKKPNLTKKQTKEQHSNKLLLFVFADKPPGSYRLQIFQDGKEIHQQPFYYMTPCESAFQSVGYLQQVFKVKDKEGLDDALVDIMERSLTEDGSLTFLFEKIQNSILAGGPFDFNKYKIERSF